MKKIIGLQAPMELTSGTSYESMTGKKPKAY